MSAIETGIYTYQPLQEVSTEQLVACFNSAFSDYEQSIVFTDESFRYYITASAVDLSLSFGAFCDGQLVAFIFNSCGVYNNQKVVFDAGTGVVPEHRGKKVFSALFEYTCQQLRDRNITRYYLEVLQSNHRAVSIYRKKGFSVEREYSVLTASGAKENLNDRVVVLPYREFKPYATRFAVKPSFEHTSYTIGQNPQLYEVRSLENRAYCVYAKKNGALIQLHYSDLDALRDVINALVHRFPAVFAKNIDCSCLDVMQVLKELGFSEILKQYEMVRVI